MNTRRFRHSFPSDAVGAFRWLGWVMLMMFVLVQPARAEGPQAQIDATGPQTDELSQASAHFDPGTHRVTVEAPAPVNLWNDTPNIGAHSFVVYEDNLRQSLEDVKAVDTPLSIGVLLEHGGRYHALNEALADAGSRAIQELEGALNPNDKITVWTYADTVEPLSSPPGNCLVLPGAQAAEPLRQARRWICRRCTTACWPICD